VQLLARLWLCNGAGVEVTTELGGNPRESDILSELSRKASVQSSAVLLGVVGCAAPPAVDNSRPMGIDDGHAEIPKDWMTSPVPVPVSAAGDSDVPAAPANEILWVN